uniref:EamA domain-containing protein n=1 Tax=Steinernema glaseri TaxID=37863 RepID=A0A1I8ATI0_9BILA
MIVGGSSSGPSRQLFGLLLLVAVNVLWVASAELTRVIFVDDSFRRPFFVTYVKTCLLIVYFLRFWICGPSQIVVGEAPVDTKYTLLQDSEDEYEPEELTTSEFEPVSVASDSEALPEHASSPSKQKRPRRVRFSLMREVRRLPSAIADEARRARLPYRPPSVECSWELSPMAKCTIALAPLWLVCSATYQTALMFSTVSSVNLLSSSSSLLVLVLAAFFGRRPSDRFTCRKLLLVLLNLSGVALVSGFSSSGAGAALALGSALAYAVYLTSFQAVCDKFGAVDMNLLFGGLKIRKFSSITKYDFNNKILALGLSHK